MDSFATFAGSAPQTRPRPGAWGVHEVLSHLVAWHERYAEILETRLAGRQPELRATTLKAMNAEAVERFRAVPREELVHRLRAAQARLDELSAQPGADRVEIRLRRGSRAYPWPDLRERAAAHVRSHERELRRR